ncbi:MAG: tetratricopeptide repeat protein [Bacteroidetes bacterium]|nr:tetratricopeptide repeat protein [Bacteroidota bacterium]
MKNILTIFLIFCISATQAQPGKADRLIQEGNKNYKQKNYSQAAEQYKSAMQADTANQVAVFNLANTYYRMNKQDEAIQLYNSLSAYKKNLALQEKALYNQGVVFGKKNSLEQSIESYKDALRLNPDDSAARENLQKALMELKKKQQPNNKPKPINNNPVSSRDLKSMEQKLNELEQKEKEVRQRMQKEQLDSKNKNSKYW